METRTRRPINIEFGKKIKQIRLSKGYGLKDIAGEMGVSITMISNIESGKSLITIEKLFLLNDFYKSKKENELFKTLFP